jgi:hypothetical protein
MECLSHYLEELCEQSNVAIITSGPVGPQRIGADAVVPDNVPGRSRCLHGLGVPMRPVFGMEPLKLISLSFVCVCLVGML